MPVLARISPLQKFFKFFKKKLKNYLKKLKWDKILKNKKARCKIFLKKTQNLTCFYFFLFFKKYIYFINIMYALFYLMAHAELFYKWTAEPHGVTPEAHEVRGILIYMHTYIKFFILYIGINTYKK